GWLPPCWPPSGWAALAGWMLSSGRPAVFSLIRPFSPTRASGIAVKPATHRHFAEFRGVFWWLRAQLRPQAPENPSDRRRRAPTGWGPTRGGPRRVAAGATG